MLAKWFVLSLKEKLRLLHAFTFENVLQEFRKGSFKFLHPVEMRTRGEMQRQLPFLSSRKYDTPPWYINGLFLYSNTYWRTAACTTMLLATTAGSSFETNEVGKRLRTSAPMQLSSKAHSMKANNRLATSGTSWTQHTHGASVNVDFERKHA